MATAKGRTTMEWVGAISEAVNYIEEHITEDITMYDMAGHFHVSPFFFHKIPKPL